MRLGLDVAESARFSLSALLANKAPGGVEKEIDMKRTLTITLQPDWAGALRQAGAKAQRGLSGKGYQGEVLNFESPAAFFGRMTERRWECEDLAGARPMWREGASQASRSGCTPGS